MDKTFWLDDAVLAALRTCSMLFEEIECDPSLADTAAFLEHYGFTAEQTCNAIIVVAKSEPVRYACCVIPSTCKLDVNKKVSQLLGIKRCSFASAEQTLQLTGMQVGGVTPIGLPEMPIFVDLTVLNNEKIVLGGGNRSSKLILNPEELRKVPHLEFVEALGIPR
ncbi:MAG: hypothetical protein K2X27_11040 [Candidatus Obscuribacterales bacterium]|nr:hypothetical protein [Candidatus Obscuribacterales bacterium]